MSSQTKIIKPHEALSFIKQHLPENPVIVEAGAFKGHDTVKMAQLWPHATIHAFEPVPELFNDLVERTKNYPNTHCYNLALSDHNGIATFHVSEHPKRPGTPSQAGSLLKPKERLKHSPIYFTGTIEVPTITLDSWAQQYNIDYVDFLWLDIQGHELAALKAAPNVLKKLRVLYVEVEFIEAYENNPQYQEVKIWFEGQEFEMVARDFPDEPEWFFGNAIFMKNKTGND